MFSVIIPTMWYGVELERMLPLLQEQTNVGEIIIINNAAERTPQYIKDGNLTKVVVHSFGFNCFVNPSWNLGVVMAKHRYVCIMNDDVLFSPDIFNAVLPLLQTDPSPIGPVKRVFNGVHPIHREHDQIPWVGPLTIATPDQPPYGWGMCLFLDKQFFKPIPTQVLIYYGDNWIWHWAKKIGQKPRTIAMNLLTRDCTTSTKQWLGPIGSVEHTTVGAGILAKELANYNQLDWTRDRQQLLDWLKTVSVGNPVIGGYN